jgi:hypothetical protein
VAERDPQAGQVVRPERLETDEAAHDRLAGRADGGHLSILSGDTVCACDH